MGAGKPDYQKLYDMGKLPKEARHHIPMLNQVDASKERIKEIENKVCDDCREKVFGNVVKKGPGRPPKTKEEEAKKEVE